MPVYRFNITQYMRDDVYVKADSPEEARDLLDLASGAGWQELGVLDGGCCDIEEDIDPPVLCETALPATQEVVRSDGEGGWEWDEPEDDDEEDPELEDAD